MFTDNGFWDTFRAQFPLNLLLHPEMHGRYLKSLLDAYDQSGWLPSWSCPGHSGGMIGNHAFSLLADAWVKGIRTFDPQQALKAMYHDATDKAPFGQSIGRSGWRDYYLKGYVRFYFIGNNLAIWDKFKWWDPELNSSDGAKYPLQKNLTVGVTVNF